MYTAAVVAATVIVTLLVAIPLGLYLLNRAAGYAIARALGW